MICSVCNRHLASEDTHTITIKNGIDDRKYIHNHFILCPACYSNFKYHLEIIGTPIEGPEDRDDIEWTDKSLNDKYCREHPDTRYKNVIHDTEWDRTHPAPGYENSVNNNPDA